MKPSHWLAFAAAVTGCAVAYGVHVFSKQDAPQPVAAATGKPKSASRERSRPSFGPASDVMPERRPRSESRQTAAAPPAQAAPPIRKIEGTPPVIAGRLLPESQWREHAHKVEMEANHELDRLVGLLDLDSYQQDQVFSALARQSPYWLPGMQAGGARSGDARTADGATAPAVGNTTGNGRAGSDAITAVGNGAGSPVATTGGSQAENVDVTVYLNADQQQTLVEEEMDRQEWWAEILPQLLPPSIPDADAGVTTGDGSGSTTDDGGSAPETKDFDGGGLILE